MKRSIALSALLLFASAATAHALRFAETAKLTRRAGKKAITSQARPGKGGKVVLAAFRLPESPDRYFVRDAKTKMISLEHVETIRARPEGIQNAEPLMRKAYEGTGGRRAPITLAAKEGGGFEVLDGNSTVAIARKHGWKTIPAHVLRTAEELAAFHEKETAGGPR
jgi:hypothetical protein